VLFRSTGVEVTIDVLDFNNNYYNIGSATTDMSGFFSFMWKPEIPGKFTVVTTFAGSKSYYSSYAETAFGVDEVPTPSPTPTPPAPLLALSPEAAYPLAIVVAAIIVAAVLLLFFRKK
jgi:hypothetical protein